MALVVSAERDAERRSGGPGWTQEATGSWTERAAVLSFGCCTLRSCYICTLKHYFCLFLSFQDKDDERLVLLLSNAQPGLLNSPSPISQNSINCATLKIIAHYKYLTFLTCMGTAKIIAS